MKMKVSLNVLILAILVISSSALGLGVDVGPSQEQVAIRAAYAELQRYADGPVHDLSFEVGDFETLAADRFDEVLYADLVTWPVGDLIGIEISTRSLEGSGSRFVHYVPRWESGDFDWSSPEGRSMTGLTVADAFRQLRREQPDWEEVESITRYRVTVHLHGKSRTYKASFFWLSNSGGSTELRFRPFDLVTQGLSAAVTERLPAREEALRAVEESPGPGVEQRLDRDEAVSEPTGADTGGEIHRVTAASTKSCQYNSQNIPQSFGGSGFNGHWSGSHTASAGFSHQCTCNTDCSLSCTATSNNSCTESGIHWDSCHDLSRKGVDRGGSVGDGTTQSADCKSGYACAQKSCLFCQCNIDISLQILATGVEFSFTDTSPDWSWQNDYHTQCAPCFETTTNDDPTGSPGVEEETNPDPNGTPIVVDLAGNGFRFTSAEDGVHFDLDRDRVAERIAWTTEGGDDAFLVADWNGNGTIDHGGELFGDRSAMPATVPPSERHGYSALAQWDDDDAGGNQDGWVSAEDLWYDRFWLWLDANHNGVSEPGELFRLEEYGIQAIELGYVDARRRDRHGNLLRFTSEVSVGDGPRRMLPGDRSHTSATDVFLRRATD